MCLDARAEQPGGGNVGLAQRDGCDGSPRDAGYHRGRACGAQADARARMRWRVVPRLTVALRVPAVRCRGLPSKGRVVRRAAMHEARFADGEHEPEGKEQGDALHVINL